MTNESTDFKNVSSHFNVDNGQNDFKVNRDSGPSRKTTSWTSTPDLTMLLDNVTPQNDKLNGTYIQNIFFPIPITSYYFSYFRVDLFF